MATVEQRFIRLTLLTFLWQCLRYYLKAKKNDQGFSYFAVASHGVPQVTVMIAHGRNAWHVSQFAADYFARGGQTG